MKKTKYVLVDRGSDYKDTAVTLLVAQDMVRLGIAISYSPVTVAQIKQGNIHVYRDQDYFRHQAFHALQDKYHGKEFEGTIRWFDGKAGEGMITLNDGQELYCHFTAIEGVDKNNHHWPKEEDQIRLRVLGNRKTRVRVKPYIDPGYIGCEIVTILKD